MNKEVHYEGWLIKSPPTKRIWRARWRRRWFTLKQGEIPEQFCLEYYTDCNCRKLKGVIDLDQCEQVDCGLRLENRKQKFQYMFDIKTPKRTYYLAADTEQDMRDWVNCICQVCHLHDTKQSLESPDESSTSNKSNNMTNMTISTVSTSLNSSTNTNGIAASGIMRAWQSFNVNTSSRGTPLSSTTVIVDQQPQSTLQPRQAPQTSYRNNTDSVYVNTDYSNRETLLCDAHFSAHQLAAAANPNSDGTLAAQKSEPSSPAALASAIYLNSPVQPIQTAEKARHVVNANGVVRKIPENLVLNNLPLFEAQTHSVQPSPALSSASGPYIPISECFSGSPKYNPEGNNPSTPLNNLDPKFYDTPRSHINIGLNLTNDQSYSPKMTNITNCVLQASAVTKGRSTSGHRSDSDSESVFTDDDEWTNPLPLRENIDRSTRPSDSSVENESFVVTYSQRFSKMPETNTTDKENHREAPADDKAGKNPLAKLAKVLKNKNNLILDFKETEKPTRELPQLSDTENTSPAIGPRDATSVVEESYDIPRSHQFPYHNITQFFDGAEINPIAGSTPNLMLGNETGSVWTPLSNVRTLPRKHCYTNAAPTKIEGNVFRYDFIELNDLPPVNRKLKPKQNIDDKPPEEMPAKPPMAANTSPHYSPQIMDVLSSKMKGVTLQSPPSSIAGSPGAYSTSSIATGGFTSQKPPSVDRNLKPSAYKGTSATIGQGTRRYTGVPLTMVLPQEKSVYLLESRTLPRHLRSNYTTADTIAGAKAVVAGLSDVRNSVIAHQRTASAAASVQPFSTNSTVQSPPAESEHKLQYFDLDVANPPVITRQSMSVGNLCAQGTNRAALSADPSARAPAQSGVVYNLVDFVKTEAFKRIREERKKESEGVDIK